MALPYRPDFNPHHPRGCEVLIESVDGDLSCLTPEQISAIRGVYHLDDPRRVDERIKAGEIDE